MPFAHAAVGPHAAGAQPTKPLFHETRYDQTAGPVGLFFLHYYPLLLTVAGLLLFAALQLRRKRG